MFTTVRRLQRLARLDLSVLDEAAADPASTSSSMITAVLAMASLGLGGWLWWAMAGLADRREVFFNTVVFGTVFSVVLWLVWLLTVFAVLQRLTGHAPRIEALVRSCGLATAPLALGLLMVVPFISFGIGLLALGAWVALTQAAIERATRAPTAAALVANLAGFAVWAAAMSLLSTAHDQLGPGPFLAESLWDALASIEVSVPVVTSD